MSKFADAVKALDPSDMGRPRLVDTLFDDDDKAAIIDRYKAGCSVKTIREALKEAGLSISDGPLIDLLKDAKVYRTAR